MSMESETLQNLDLQGNSGAGGQEPDSNLVDVEYEVEVKLADIQADPNSALYSVKSFEDLGLRKELLDGIYAMKYAKPSKIQERALPLLLSNPPQNLIAQSQSGTGKTAAFTLTMLSRVVPDIKQPQALCLAPSRELARQNLEVARTMGKYTDITYQLLVPDSIGKDERVTAQVVVGTPGKINDLLRRRLLDVSKLQVFVLDEADNMLDQQGLGAQCSRVKAACPPNVQTVLFSATFDEKVYEYALKFVPKPNEIRLKQSELNVQAITQIYMDCANEQEKYETLVKLYGLLTIASSIIFVRTKRTADQLAAKMIGEGHKVSVLHGDIATTDRDKIIDDFREHKTKVLITTNVLSRGIDVPTVSMVVNYDMPTDADGNADPSTYLHRIGRTGRFGRTGVAVSFVHDQTSYKLLSDIKSYFGEGITMTQVPTGDWEVVEKTIKKAIKGSK